MSNEPNALTSAPGAPHSGGRSRNRTAFALIIDALGDWYGQNILRGVSDFASENGAHLICVVAPVREEVCPLRDLIGPLNVDGVIVVTSILSNFEKDPNTVARFFDRYKPLPCVSIGVPIEGAYSLTIDNRAGMNESLRHLINTHGFRKVAFVRGPETNQEAELRFQVYKDVLAQNQIPYDPELVVNGDWSQLSGAMAVHTLKDVRKCDIQAIVAADDSMASGAIEALHARGLRVPSDIAVIGFDNDLGLGFSLTTVHQPVYLLGRKAASMLLDAVRGVDVPRSVTLPTELIVRRSCGCYVADVTNSVAQPAVGTTQPPGVLLAERREATLAALMNSGRGLTSGVRAEWPERIFDTFVREITGEVRGEFLPTLDAILVQEWMEHRTMVGWQNVISVLRRELLPCMTLQETVTEAENLWHQARVLVDDAVERMHAHQQEQSETQAMRLMNVNATFFSKDLKSLADAFAQKLPSLGIERCYAVTFESDAAVPEWARLVLAYDEEEHIELEAQGLRFPAKQLIPDDFLPDYRPVTLWASHLNKGSAILGLIFFEMGPMDSHLYETLRRQFSEPLHRILRGPPGPISS
jgi:sigma-B regulation protein RsbU (phosphoserine phosphatase)